MERLTTKNGGGHYLDLSDNPFSYDSIVCKLGAFEDFMEELGLDTVEELRKEYDDKFGFAQALITENQALKDRWQKLKSYLINTIKEKDNSLKYYKFREIVDKMQELEDRQ